MSLEITAWAQLQILGYVVIAMALAATIGFEREHADKPAGLRTHMLVAGAAALLVGLSDMVIMSSEIDPTLVRSDPIRIIEAIITGMSFLAQELFCTAKSMVMWKD
ncbi:MAG: MgtC/SapB family protein [Caldilineaceae bacterium]